MARKPADPEEDLRWMAQEERGYVEAVLNSIAANVPKLFFAKWKKLRKTCVTSYTVTLVPKVQLGLNNCFKRTRMQNVGEGFAKNSRLISKLLRQLGIHNNQAAAAST